MRKNKKPTTKNGSDVCVKDASQQSSTGMVLQEPAELERRKKKRIIKLVAIVLAAAVLLTAIGGVVAGLLTFNREGTLFYNMFKRGKLSAPQNLRLEDFDQEKDFALLIKWDDVAKATGYTLEVEYELYPDAPVSYEVALNGRYVERKRGEMRYRVKSKNLTDTCEFTQWQTFDISSLALDLPEISLHKDEEYVYFSWSNVTYKYFNDFGNVSYQFADGGYFLGESPETWENPPQYSSGGVEYKIELADLRTRCDVFTIKVRPLNYTIFWSTEKFTYVVLNEPVELYDTYELGEIWAEMQLDLTE